MPPQAMSVEEGSNHLALADVEMATAESLNATSPSSAYTPHSFPHQVRCRIELDSLPFDSSFVSSINTTIACWICCRL